METSPPSPPQNTDDFPLPVSTLIAILIPALLLLLICILVHCYFRKSIRNKLLRNSNLFHVSSKDAPCVAVVTGSPPALLCPLKQVAPPSKASCLSSSTSSSSTASPLTSSSAASAFVRKLRHRQPHTHALRDHRELLKEKQTSGTTLIDERSVENELRPETNDVKSSNSMGKASQSEDKSGSTTSSSTSSSFHSECSSPELSQLCANAASRGATKSATAVASSSSAQSATMTTTYSDVVLLKSPSSSQTSGFSDDPQMDNNQTHCSASAHSTQFDPRISNGGELQTLSCKYNSCQSSSLLSPSSTPKDRIEAEPLCKASCNGSVGFDEKDSGSGKGRAMLAQSTISDLIVLDVKIGEGRFGDVWRGVFHSEAVAVKMFPARHEASWSHETRIYQTCHLRHPNLLQFIASDLTTSHADRTTTRLWLVTRLHPQGNLYDWLRHRGEAIDPSDPSDASDARQWPIQDVRHALSLAHSAAAGLCYLHTEIRGSSCLSNGPPPHSLPRSLEDSPPHSQHFKCVKPVMAHRDIKSKNLLVSDDGRQCVWADLGLAAVPTARQHHEHTRHRAASECYVELRQNCTGSSQAPYHPNNLMVGTRRYMAPELLRMCCQHDEISTSPACRLIEIDMSFLIRADLYAFSLVQWEILRALEFNYNSEPFNESELLPFYEYAPENPTLEEMNDIVTLRKIRPTISDESKKKNILNGLK